MNYKMYKINHLYRRAGFGLSPSEWQKKKNWSVNQAVDHLFAEAASKRPLPTPPKPDVVKNKDLSKEEIKARKKQESNWSPP